MRENNKYIGAPFKWGGRDMNGFDCYGLVKAILKENGIEIPDQKTPDGANRIVQSFVANIPFWEEVVVAPKTVLLFRIPGGFHIGYCEENDKFIHTWEKSAGVVRERVLLWEKRLIGAYRYVG